MEMLAISFFVIAIVYITYVAVRSMMRILSIAYRRKKISARSHQIMATTSVVIGISIAIMLPIGSIKLLRFLF